MWKSGNILCYPQFLWISGRLHNRMLTSACCNKNMDILLYCYHFSILVYLKNRISKNKTIGFLPVLLNTAKCCTSTERKKHLSSCQHASERWHNVPSVSLPNIPDCLEFTESIFPSPVAGRMLTTKTVFTGSHVWQATPVEVRGSLLFFFYLSYLRCIITHFHW